MKRILITGATGLLGTTLASYLKERGFCIIKHARTGDADFLGDLSDREKAFETLSQIRSDIIINLASLTNVELCQDQPNIAYLANTRTVENLAHWIQKAKPNCYLVHISTDHLYDRSVLNTEDETTLTNIYAFSKYAGELAAVRVPSSILRTNFIGQSKVSHRESFSDWVYKAIIDGRYVQLLDDVFFSPLSLSTLVEMIQLVLEKTPVGIFNLGSHNGMSKADFAFALAECLKLPTAKMSRIKIGQATFLKTYRPRDMRMDCSRFENTLGVKLPQLTDEVFRVAKEYHEIT